MKLEDKFMSVWEKKRNHTCIVFRNVIENSPSYAPAFSISIWAPAEPPRLAGLLPTLAVEGDN